MDFLRALIDPRFMPHGHCYFWQPQMVWLQVVSNLVIGCSYLAISLTLLALTRRLRQLPFHRAYLAFGLFIVSCGMTHFMDIVTVWRGVYWLDGALRAFTAAASAATALWLFPLFPQVVQFGELVSREREKSRATLEEELRRRRELQAALTASERQFRELVDNLPDLAWSASPDGAIDFYNRRWYEYTGTSLALMAGWGWKSVHDPAMVDAVVARWQASLASGEPFEMEYPLRRADGAYRWFLSRVQPLHDDAGTVLRWIGTNTDIDEQRRAKAALQRSVQVRDEFLSVASHELRTPLTALLLQLQIARRGLDRGDERARLAERLTVADKQIARMSSLVESMLDVSQISLGRVALEPADCDLAQIARDVVARAQETADRAGSTVTIDAPAALTGRWDRSRLDQVVTNLVSNAIKYGAGKPIELAVRGAAPGAPVKPDHVVLEVRDHGIGIPAQDRERVFERFERAVSARHFGGLGLGLFICREIVEAHGGAITLESAPGQGSVFRVTLPLRAVEESS